MKQSLVCGAGGTGPFCSLMNSPQGCSLRLAFGPAIMDSRYARGPLLPEQRLSPLLRLTRNEQPTGLFITGQPLTAPSIMPLTKKRWKNG